MACTGYRVHIVEGPDNSFCGEAICKTSQREHTVDIVKVENIPRVELFA